MHLKSYQSAFTELPVFSFVALCDSRIVKDTNVNLRLANKG